MAWRSAGAGIAVVLAALSAPVAPAGGACRQWNPPYASVTPIPLIDHFHGIAVDSSLVLLAGVQQTPYYLYPYLVAYERPDDLHFDLPFLGSLRIPTDCQDLCLDGTRAYMTHATTTLSVVDVSDPAAMARSPLEVLRGPGRDMLLVPEHRILIVAEWDAVRFYSLADPDNPVLVASVPAAGAWALDRSGDLLAVASATMGLRLIDITAIEAPHELAVLPVGGNVRDVALWNGKALLVGPTVGLVTVDVSQPDAPSLLSLTPCDGEAGQLVIHADYAYVQALVDQGYFFADNVQLFRLFADAPPSPRGGFFPTREIGTMATVEDFLLLGTSNGLVATLMQCGPVADVRNAGAEGRVLLNAWPNPCNPRAILAFALPAPAHVRLAVYDIAGRLVRCLVPGEEIPSGRHERVWDGADDAGRPVPSGVYLCRLEAGDHRATKRLVLVR